jgi:hypothetical protein
MDLIHEINGETSSSYTHLPKPTSIPAEQKSFGRDSLEDPSIITETDEEYSSDITLLEDEAESELKTYHLLPTAEPIQKFGSTQT